MVFEQAPHLVRISSCPYLQSLAVKFCLWLHGTCSATPVGVLETKCFNFRGRIVQGIDALNGATYPEGANACPIVGFYSSTAPFGLYCVPFVQRMFGDERIIAA